ncbi:DUF2493 domain-containing protein [Streptomyces sp. NPDC020490]|uniref:DUF2493 domain-containing protein n=1 Tax=Streptomyces sp. NPDC020490 TaxID=3365078 RepID=UPI00378EEAA9
MKPYRVLVTGSRDWDDVEAIWQAMNQTVRDAGTGREIVVVHGACPRGADWHADRWARLADVKTERHPANWQINGKRAGFIRNAHMVNLGADICLAFIRNGSRGASHTAALAEQAGIPVRRWTA